LLEQLPPHWAMIRAAPGVRDPWRRGRRPSASPRGAGRGAFTPPVAALRRRGLMSIAPESRGLGVRRRTIAAPSNLTPADLWVSVIALAGTAVVLLGSWQLGTLRGLG